jgi:outer membrane protein OmpA-like peptidoglycan-associated protein
MGKAEGNPTGSVGMPVVRIRPDWPGRVLPLLVVALLSMALVPATGLGEDEAVSDAIFTPIEELVSQARSQRADVLSPSYFAKGTKELSEARALFDEGKSLKDIERRLERAEENNVTLGSALEARDAALSADAPRYAEELFERGEKFFQEAGRKVEKGNVKDAKVKAADAERRFREAELIAIKTTVIGEVRGLLAEADREEAEEWAPRSLGNARQKLADAERQLEEDRYRRSETVAMAREAEVEARRGLAIAAAARQANLDHGAYEAVVLDAESQVRNIATPLGYEPDFEAGLAAPIAQIIKGIEALKAEKESLTLELSAATSELDELRKKERGLKAELEVKREREERVKRVVGIFDSDEVTFVRQGSRLTFHLKGVTFPTAKSVLLPENYALLSKVMRAIRELPGASITIEGHTDSMGDERRNVTLSQERAEAVRAYIEANMDLSDRLVSTVGYGETKPVATNDTEEGRALNRRIDVVFNASSLLGE